MNHNTSMKTSSHGKKKSKKRTSSGIASSSSSSTTIASSDTTNHKNHHDNNNKNNVVTIQVIQSNDNHENQHPIVCSFPGGIPSSCTNSTSSEEQEQQLTFQWLKKSKSTMNRNNSNINGQEYVIKGQDTACQYYGNCIINNNNTSTPSNMSTTSSLSSSHTKLCVAIYDKFTNKLVVTPTIGNGTIISLQQFVPSYYNNKNNNNDDDNDNTTSTRTTNALLFADFGSAKKRRVLQSQEANRVTVDAVVAIGTANSSSKNNKNNANDMIFHNSKMSESNRIAIQQQQQMNMAIEATTTPSSNNNIDDDNDDDDVEQGQGTTNINNTNTNSSMNLAIEIATNSWRQTFLPNYNVNAKNAKDIYNVSLIVGYDIWNHTLQNIIKKYNILNDTNNNGTSIIQYFNRNNINNSNNESHPYHTNHKDIIYCTELVQKLIETKIKYNQNNTSQNQNQQQQQVELYKCILLLNYCICLYKQFQSNKFKLPMINTSLSDETDDNDDNDDDIDNDNTDINDSNDNTNNVKRNTLSLRTKLYGTTPISLLQRFLDLFTTSTNFDHTISNSNTTKHIMSRAQQDKCLVHIFIIYIMTYATSNNNDNNKNNNIDNGIVISDIVPLFYELQLNDNINHGILLLRQAGCIVTRTNTPSSFCSSKDTNSSKPQKKIKVELNVPLRFPKTKKKQR